jgi:hypothetical protein
LELKLVENWTFLVQFMCEMEPKQTFERKIILKKWKKKRLEPGADQSLNNRF